MARQWTAEDVLRLAGSFQQACVLAAAVDLDLFAALAGRTLDAESIARQLQADGRGMRILLDALAAIELLTKKDGKYSVPADVAEILAPGGAQSRLAMVQHQSNCLRRWAQLGRTIKTGQLQREESIRGQQADYASFIEAMDNIGRSMAGPLVAQLQPMAFSHLLDIGGASGTYTIALLQAAPGARATIFDLPEVIPHAKARISEAGLADRVGFAAGDFYKDELPKGVDFAWVSAIIHQNSPEQNRGLYRKVHAALVPGGQIAIRDIVMDETRTRPVAGAMFAVNMLAGTPLGDTYTFQEIKGDLEACGFGEVSFWRQGEGMDSVVKASKLR